MYNSQIRQIINGWVNEGIQKGYSVKASLKDKVTDIYLLFGTEKTSDIVSISMLLSIIYVDSFMIYSYRQKEAISLDSDTEILAQLYDIDDLTQLYNDASIDPNLLCAMLEASYQFYNMNFLGKATIVKSLSPSENAWLLSKFSNHQQNLDLYGGEIFIGTLIRECQKMIKYQREKMLMRFDEAVNTSILGFVRNLCKIDPVNAASLLYGIGRIDYMASKYLVGQGLTDETLTDHIDRYENYDIDDVLDLLSINQNFLMDAIIMMTAVYAHKEYGGKKIDEDAITSSGVSGFTKKMRI